MVMDECPFLSTYDNDVNCFRDCALYNYKGTGGICPFKSTLSYKINGLDKNINELELFERDLTYIKEIYLEKNKQYF